MYQKEDGNYEGLQRTDVSFTKPVNQDLSIDPQTELKCRELIAQNQGQIQISNRALESAQDRWASSPDFGQGEKISVQEYLIRNPGILERHSNLNRSFNGVEYSQAVRFSTLSETSLLSQIRRIADGKFSEIFVLAGTLDDGSARRSFAFSASGEVTQEDIDKEIGAFKASVGEKKLTRVNLIHNHPDQFAKTKMWSIQDPPAEGEVDTEVGLISTNSLTDRDIRTTDEISQKFFPGVNVSMSAISENGLTYTYQAGTAKYSEPSKIG